jgi:peptidoglycan-associated lipoprotein
MRSISATVILSLGLLASVSGCQKKPEYPACKKDKHCEPGETCVDGLCQNCQADTDCKGKGPNGEDLSCVDFRCEAPSGECQTAADCDPGMVCNANKCEFCTDGSQCESGVCNDSGRCEPMPCSTDDDCPVDEVCDGGQCIYHPLNQDQAGAVCGISALYFAFDSAKLSPSNQEQLTTAAPCFIELAQGGGGIVLEAHADNVGTEEYNILLTDRRGTSVRSFLANLGVPDDQLRVVGKGALEAHGTDESSRSKDRRVQFIVEGQ